MKRATVAAALVRSLRLLQTSAVLLSSAVWGTEQTSDRIPIWGEINGRSVTLFLDTGSETSGLFRNAVERIGLKPHTQGRNFYDLTEEFNWIPAPFTWLSGPAFQRGRSLIVDRPSFLEDDFDGFIGWPGISNLVFEFNMQEAVLRSGFDLPKAMDDWNRWKLVQGSPVLIFGCAYGTNSVRIGIDTGSEHGVWLSPRRWRELRARVRPQALTLETAWSPTDGLLTREVLRAKRVDVGDLTLTNMPVSEALPSEVRAFSGCDAILGMFVFTRLAIISDGSSGSLYTKPVTRPFPDYDYNRLGAVFVPKDIGESDDLVAHVIKGSSAYRAGICDGDVLLKVGIRNVTKWRTDPTIKLNGFWSQPAGTKLKLTLKRGDKQYETTVTLEEIPAVD